jgi:hypothetical protein
MKPDALARRDDAQGIPLAMALTMGTSTTHPLAAPEGERLRPLPAVSATSP